MSIESDSIKLYRDIYYILCIFTVCRERGRDFYGRKGIAEEHEYSLMARIIPLCAQQEHTQKKTATFLQSQNIRKTRRKIKKKSIGIYRIGKK